MNRFKHNTFFQLFFFGNYFAGVCAIALSLEGSLQQHVPLFDPLFYILAFAATVSYYSLAYIRTEFSPESATNRTSWYTQHHTLMNRTQAIFLFILVIGSVYFAVKNIETILNLSLFEWTLIILFPLVSAFYYGVDNKFIGKHNLRNIGWLKPLIIGFTWAGLVTVFPVMFYAIEHTTHYELTLVGCFLFLKNVMFITVLSVLFDIKDYAMDYNVQLKTLVVKLGLRKTLFYIIIPLCVVGLCSFLIYAHLQNFSLMKRVINTLPFLAVIAVTYSMYNRRDIFYYLIVIDGLMLFKALCGITAMIFF
ncbi:MAG: hypothetical protein PSX36_12300 [bacterium]|nr:hypothetical protein [bacterium]